MNPERTQRNAFYESTKRSRSKASSPILYSLKIKFEVRKNPELTGLEPATSCVTGRHSNQLSYSSLFLRYFFKGTSPVNRF